MVDKSTKNMEELFKISPLLAIEKTQYESIRYLLSENQQGVVHNSSLEHSLENMETANIFFQLDEKPNDDIFWK